VSIAGARSGFNIKQILKELPQTLTEEIANAISRQKEIEFKEQVLAMVLAISFCFSKNGEQKLQNFLSRKRHKRKRYTSEAERLVLVQKMVQEAVKDVPEKDVVDNGVVNEISDEMKEKFKTMPKIPGVTEHFVKEEKT